MRWLILACGLCGAIATNSAWAQTRLEYKFREGETRRYSLEEEKVATVRLPGSESATRDTTRQKLEFSWTAEKARPERFDLRHKNSHMRLSWLDAEGQEILAIDSAKGDDQGGFKVPSLRELAQGEIEFRVTPRGAISDWKLSPKFAAAVKAQAESQGLASGDDDWRYLLDQILPPLPAEPVSKGSRWQQRTQRKLPFGEITIVRNFTYRGSTRRNNRDVEWFELRDELSLAPAKWEGGDFKITASESKGDFYFDRRMGGVVEMTQHQSLTLKVVADGAEGQFKLGQTAALTIVE